MPQPPHAHCNHPPTTPHPKTVFLSDLSVCITDSSEGTPVALHNRFNELSTISEIPEIPNSPPPLPSNASPPHTPSQTSMSSYTYTCHRTTFAYLTSSFTGTYHSHPTCSRSLVHYTTYYTNRCHHESKQLDERWLCLFSLFKLIGSRDCRKHADASDILRGRGSFTHTAASTRYCLTNPFSHPFEHVHVSSFIMPSSNNPHRQHHHKTHMHGN